MQDCVYIYDEVFDAYLQCVNPSIVARSYEDAFYPKPVPKIPQLDVPVVASCDIEGRGCVTEAGYTFYPPSDAPTSSLLPHASTYQLYLWSTKRLCTHYQDEYVRMKRRLQSFNKHIDLYDLDFAGEVKDRHQAFAQEYREARNTHRFFKQIGRLVLNNGELLDDHLIDGIKSYTLASSHGRFLYGDWIKHTPSYKNHRKVSPFTADGCACQYCRTLKLYAGTRATLKRMHTAHPDDIAQVGKHFYVGIDASPQLRQRFEKTARQSYLYKQKKDAIRQKFLERRDDPDGLIAGFLIRNYLSGYKLSGIVEIKHEGIKAYSFSNNSSIRRLYFPLELITNNLNLNNLNLDDFFERGGTTAAATCARRYVDHNVKLIAETREKAKKRRNERQRRLLASYPRRSQATKVFEHFKKQDIPFEYVRAGIFEHLPTNKKKELEAALLAASASVKADLGL